MAKVIGKKVLSATLALIIILSMFTFSAMAEETAALAAINSATSGEEIATAITTYVTDLTTAGIDLTIYNNLSQISKDAINTALVNATDYDHLAATYMLEGDSTVYTSANPFITAFNNAVKSVTYTRFNPLIEDMNYVTGDADINRSSGWVSKMLYKFDLTHPMYDSDYIAQIQTVVMKNDDTRNADNKTGTVTITDISTNWSEYVDNKTSLDSKGIMTSTSSYSYSYTSKTLIAKNTYEAYDITNYIKDKISANADLAAIRIEGLPAGFYEVTQNNNINKLGLYVTYDKNAMLNAFNTATTETIGELLINNGGVFNFDVSGYSNLTSDDKSKVNTALVAAKPFADFANISAAYEAAVSTLVYTKTYNIAEDYSLAFTNTITKTDYTNNYLFLSYNGSSLNEFDFDLSTAPRDYISSIRLYVRSRAANTYAQSARFIDMLSDGVDYTGREQNVLDVVSWPKTGGVFNWADVTNAVIGTDGVMKIGVMGVGTDLLNAVDERAYISPKADGTSNQPYVKISYNLDAIVKDLDSVATKAEVETILTNYGTMLGVSASDLANNLSSISLAVNRSNFSTLAEFQSIVANYATIVNNNILPMLNETTTLNEFKAFINEYKAAIGLDYTTFSRLAMQDKILSDLYEAKGTGFESLNAVITTFNSLVAANISTPIRSIATADYAFGGGDGSVNGSSNWCKNFLTKFSINGEVNTSSEFLVRVKYYQKQATRGEAALNNESVTLHEVSPYVWEESPATPHDTVAASVAITDTASPVATSIVTCANGSYFGIDVSNYFITNGKFNKTPGQDFALRMGFTNTTKSSFFQDGQDLTVTPYLSFEYDIAGIVNAVNTATKDTIQGILERNGSVIGINVSAYENLSKKSSVNQAVLGKNFQDATSLAAAANAAIDAMLYTETFAIGAAQTTNWGNITTADVTSAVGAADFWMSNSRYSFGFFNFDRTASQFDTKYTAFVQIGLQRRNGGEPLASDLRYMLYSSDNSVSSVVSYGYNQTSNQIMLGDITSIAQNTAGPFTVYARGSILTGTGNMLQSPNKSGGHFEVYVKYDKLAVANDIANCATVEAAEAMLDTYYPVVGLATKADGDYTVYARSLFGETIETPQQLQTLLSTAELRSVTLTNLSATDITAADITGTVTVKNLTTSPAGIKIIVAAFKENNEMIKTTIVDTSADNDIIGALGVKTYNYSLEDVSNVKEIRAFIWNGFTDLIPYDMPKIIVNQ